MARRISVPQTAVAGSASAVLVFLFLNCFDAAVPARIMDPDIKKKPSVRDVQFFTVEKGTKSGIKTPDRVVIRDEEDWITLWRRHKTEDLASRTIPPVDFDRCMVIAVFQGQESLEAGLIQIERIKMFSDKLAVYISETDSNLPPADPNGARSTTCSYHIVKTARTALPVVFN